MRLKERLSTALAFAIDEGGMVLIVALLVMTVLSLLGTSFLLISGAESGIATNLTNTMKAFDHADAGIEHAKRVLPGTDLNTALANGGTLSFGASVPFAGGTYQVVVSNNTTTIGSISADPGGPTTDTDGRVVVTSTGTYRNALKVVQAVMEVPAILSPPSSIFTLNGPDGTRPADFTFDGNSFLVQGRDTTPGQTTPITGGSAFPALGVMDCPTCNPGQTPLEEAGSSLGPGQADNLTGTGADPSISPVSSPITADYLTKLKSTLTPIADVTYSGSTTISGGTLGAQANPQVTVVNGDLDLQGNASGVGVLLVTGRLRIRGNATFQGLILVDGNDGRMEMEGTSKVWGSIIHINRDPAMHSGETRLTIRGNAEVYYSRQALRNAGGALSAIILAWLERP